MEMFDKILGALRVKNFEKEAEKEVEDKASVGFSRKGIERNIPVNAIIVPKDGLVWNPLRSYPRNLSCFCGKEKKAKNCCLPKAKAAVPPHVAAEIKSYIDGVKARHGK